MIGFKILGYAFILYYIIMVLLFKYNFKGFKDYVLTKLVSFDIISFIENKYPDKALNRYLLFLIIYTLAIL